MSSDHSVTHWIGRVRGGDAEATRELWERYFERIVRFARRKLQGTSRRASDEEDVALSAFHSFVREAPRFARLDDRDDLWQVLAMLTARKAFQERRRQQASRRGGLHGEDGRRCPTTAEGPGFDDVPDSRPGPESAVMVGEQLQTLFTALPDEDLRRVARLRLEDHTNAEIAATLNCSERTVERKVVLIRGFWERAIPA